MHIRLTARHVRKGPLDFESRQGFVEGLSFKSFPTSFSLKKSTLASRLSHQNKPIKQFLTEFLIIMERQIKKGLPVEFC